MLSGNLGIFPLPDVIKVVAGRDITGRILVRRDAVSGEFSVDRGKVVSARLAEDEPPANLDEAIDVAVVLFDGTGGTFEVQPEEWIGGPLELEPDALGAAVDERREAWAAIIDCIGSLEDPPLLALQLPEDATEITITADQWRLVTLMDGIRTVPDIARDSSLSVFATATALSEMEKAGIVARGVRGSRPDASSAPARFVGGPGSNDPPQEILLAVGGGGGGEAEQPIALEPIRERRGRFSRR